MSQYARSLVVVMWDCVREAILREFWSIEGLRVLEIVARYGVCYLSAKFTTNVPLFVLFVVPLCQRWGSNLIRL